MIILFIVSAYSELGLIDDWTRIYKTQSRAQKRFNELINEYQVNAIAQKWIDGKYEKWLSFHKWNWDAHGNKSLSQ